MIIKDLFEKVLIDQRLVIIDHNSSAYEAAVSMLKNRCGALLVCDHKNDDTLLGIISERDLTFRVIPKDLDPKKTKVSKIMTKNVETIQPNRTTFDAIQIMKSKGFRHLPLNQDFSQGLPRALGLWPPGLPLKPPPNHNFQICCIM